ncbi:MAG: 2-oxoacid:ferredoxin oxidoreductase subunit beta [Rhodospirillaceae bacterium]
MTVLTKTPAADPNQKLTNKDFESDQEIRWCPGCGDYAILKAVQKTLPDLNVPKEKFVFVSGIGCSSRFPYYMSTFGFHTIHGRAPAVATGVKLANPELDVWLVTGDGDGLSIGGNHLLHVLRRNVDMNILLFNNAIYGLTKGQYSPTSEPGTRSPSSPGGSIDRALNPAKFALGAGAPFVARAAATLSPHLISVLKAAHGHRGASFVEIYQNCIVYNDGVFDNLTDKRSMHDAHIQVEHGKPLLFGKDKSRGLRLNMRSLGLEMVTLGEDGVTEADILVHDATNPILAQMLVAMEAPFPVALGVIFDSPALSHDDAVHTAQGGGKRRKPVSELLNRGKTWTVEASA